MGVELPLRVVVTILGCCVTFSGVKLSIRSFVLFLEILQFPRSSKILWILPVLCYNAQYSLEMNKNFCDLKTVILDL